MGIVDLCIGLRIEVGVWYEVEDWLRGRGKKW